jgi:hypothetical protein
MEALKFTGMILLILVAYSLMGNDDYHKMFDKPYVIRYDCNELTEDAPREILDKCMNTTERYINVKAYKE